VSLTDGLLAYYHLTDTPATYGWADAVGLPFVKSGTVAANAAGALVTSNGGTAENGSYLRPLINDDLFAPSGSFTFVVKVLVPDASGLGAIDAIPVVSKGGAVATAYALVVFPGLSRVDWNVPGTSGNYFAPSALALIDGASFNVEAGVWLACWVDRDTNQIGVRINNVTPVTAAFSQSLYDSAQPLHIGTFLNMFAPPVPTRYSKLAFYNRVLSASEIDSLFAGTEPYALPAAVQAGESFTVSEPEDGEATALYYLLGDPATIPEVPVDGLRLFVDAEYNDALTLESGTTWASASATIDTSAIATGEHTATLEWVTNSTSVEQPEKLQEADFTTTESLLRAVGVDTICVEPNGTATIRFRGITTDNQSVETAAFAVDWDDCGTQSGSTFTAGASEVVGFADEDAGRSMVVVRNDRGIAHFDSDGEIRYGYAAGSTLTYYAFQFGGSSFVDTGAGAYSLSVRDECLSVGLGFEASIWIPPDFGQPPGTTMDYATWLALVTGSSFLTTQWAADRDIYSGPRLLTGDTFWGLAFPWLSDYIDNGHLQDLFTTLSTVQQTYYPTARVQCLVDEVNFRYGNDPTNTGEIAPGYAPLAALAELDGGLATLIEYTRSAGFPPIMWGMFGLTFEADRDYSDWLTTTYCDGIDQYQTTLFQSSATYGSHSRHNLASLRLAARIRQPSRPFSTNTGLITAYGYVQEDGSIPIISRGMTRYSLPASIWMPVMMGASIPRMYFLEGWRSRLDQEGIEHEGELVQYAVRPEYTEEYPAHEWEDPTLWNVVRANLAAVNDYTRELLGTERSHPWGGPDFNTIYRLGSMGRIYVAVNLSRLHARPPPFALNGLGAFTFAEIIDGDTRTEIDVSDALTTDIPGGGVLILTGVGVTGDALEWDDEMPVGRWSFR
jgi:hypothetical protein